MKIENFHWEDQPRENGFIDFFLLETNHLGNVLEVVTDRKLQVETAIGSGVLDYYSADVVSQSDYFPFGMLLPNTSDGPEEADYRFGFNGMEKDDEVSGNSNSYDFGARFYNPRVGRWLIRDPKESKQPSWSPYKAFYNSPLVFVDPSGKIEIIVTAYVDAASGRTVISVREGSRVMTDGSHYVRDSQDFHHIETDWYDFMSITIITLNEDGSTSYEASQKIIYERGIVETDVNVTIDAYRPGDIAEDRATEKGTNMLLGVTVTGGDARSGSQDYSENASNGSISLDDLASIAKSQKLALSMETGLSFKYENKYNFTKVKSGDAAEIKKYVEGVDLTVEAAVGLIDLVYDWFKSNGPVGGESTVSGKGIDVPSGNGSQPPIQTDTTTVAPIPTGSVPSSGQATVPTTNSGGL